MHRIGRITLGWGIAAIPALSAMAEPVDLARRNAELAAPAWNEIHRWLHEVALPAIDRETKLFAATGETWTYRDTAADCFPFLGWAAWFTDREVFETAVRECLRAEARMLSHHGPVPVDYTFSKKAQMTDEKMDMVIFGAAEYMKDGLVALVEADGPGEFADRMKAIADELWKRASVETPHGRLVSTNLEVNGDLMQVLIRLYGLTQDRQYLEYACRMADYYLADPPAIARHLDDHGCEMITGLGTLQGVLARADPQRERRYRPGIRQMLDAILERGRNSDGILLHTLADQPGPHDDRPLTDNWGYDYVSFLCYWMVTGETRYRDAVREPLRNLARPKYHLYPWEGTNIDGHADSIEGALYLLSVMPVPEGDRWADREVADALLAKPIDGTSKFECNAIRTVTLYARSRTAGVHIPAWRRGLRLGAAPDGEGLVLVVSSTQKWDGRLVFDIPRHRLWLHFERDWPRINYLPEYFTVEPDRKYTVTVGSGPAQIMTGRSLRDGLPVHVEARQEVVVAVRPAD